MYDVRNNIVRPNQARQQHLQILSFQPSHDDFMVFSGDHRSGIPRETVGAAIGTCFDSHSRTPFDDLARSRPLYSGITNDHAL